MRVRKIIAGTAIGLTAFGGGVVGAVGLSPITALAQDAADEAQKPADWVSSALAGLVDDGEITQDQADLVETRLQEAKPEGRFGRHARGGHFGGRGGAESATALADVLNTTPEELFSAVRDGQTLGDIAGEQGVTTDELIEIFTADKFAAIDEKVASGDIDAAEAAEFKAAISERAEAMIDGDFSAGRGGFGKGHGGRFGHNHADTNDSEIGEA